MGTAQCPVFDQSRDMSLLSLGAFLLNSIAIGGLMLLLIESPLRRR